MKFFRRLRLVVIPACFFALSICPALLSQTPAQAPAQQPPAGQPPAQPQQQAPPTTPPKPSPFETIPTAPQATPPPAAQPAAPAATPAVQPAQPGQRPPQLEAPKEAPAPAVNPNGQRLKALSSRRQAVPQDTLKALIISKPGDLYNEETLRRDFMILWNTGRFDDIRLETEPGRTGLIVRFVVTERRVIRSIEYPGAKSVTVSEILDRFKERKVGLSVESQYDPNKIQRAAVVLKEFLGERGRQYATVEPQIEQIPPSSLNVSFVVNEGPKVKVGNIDITGNSDKDDRWVIRNMKNLKGIGVLHSILSSVSSRQLRPAKLEEDV
jgi:outer membrane protein insertion porin family